jgi:sugar phosphate isomerase/epimerase
MPQTRTGSYPIGFRRGWSDWQRDLGGLIEFARANDFAFLDFGPAPAEDLRRVLDAGVRVGAVDLKDWKLLVSPDADRRKVAAEENAAYVRAVTELGVRVFLTALIPEDPARPREENFVYAVDAYRRLLEAIAPTGARIVLEGWPGQAPHYGTIGCTPADCRALFAEIHSDAVGVNFDPSHLVRMGIDPVRFAREFAPRIFHAHAKDTLIVPDELYEQGNLQPATFAKPHAFGGHSWRYAIPGQGDVPWGPVLAALRDVGYRGPLSIELEDEQFNGTTAGEQRALLAARDFLAAT